MFNLFLVLLFALERIRFECAGRDIVTEQATSMLPSRGQKLSKRQDLI
jgi:hypothetical protein